MTGVYKADHINWNTYDEIIFSNNNHFHRKNIPKENGTYVIEKTKLILRWNNWPEEILYTIDNHASYSCKSHKFTLSKISISQIKCQKSKNINNVELITQNTKTLHENPVNIKILEKPEKNLELLEEKEIQKISKEFVQKKIKDIESKKDNIIEPKEIVNKGVVRNMVNNLDNQLTGYYINLQSRKDRNKHVMNNIINIPFFSNVQRLDAVKDNRRGIGCNLSHIKALESIMRIKEPLDYYIIIEDDIRINKPKFQLFLNEFNQEREKEWDVIVLGGSYLHVKKGRSDLRQFHKIIKSQTTVGYIVKRRYIPELINNFKESMNLYLKTKNYLKYAMDVHWHVLQGKGKWYICRHFFCDQIVSYSDIENRSVDYKDCYASITYVK